MGRGGADLLQALLEAEGRLLAGVLQHGHHYAVKQACCPLDQVEVAQGEGIEAAGVEGAH